VSGASTERFAALGRAPEGAIRLAEAALWIAATEYADLDVAAWLRRLDALGAGAARAVGPESGADEAATALGRLLFEREGFRGNAEEYYDPRNSFLNDVLDRRLGIPITLSVVYLDVAAAAGVTAHGVGLPGHFVVRVERAGETRLVDPFHGGRLLSDSEGDCLALVRRVLRQPVPFDPTWLRPVTTVEIVARMLTNLKGVYVRASDWPRALRTAECLVALRPEVLGEVRDRGAVHARLGDTRAAIRDWERYLSGAPEASDAAEVRHQLRAARQSLAVLN
jgi:regulator of sirC expression with transglutaminase-like and TPR domain